jgi:adenine-specific DNA-methyltransferase
MKVKSTDKKLRGGYYTPKEISKFLAQWAILKNSHSILEPSCGDGNILEQCYKAIICNQKDNNLENYEIVGVELDKSEALKAKNRLKGLGANNNSVKILTGDFFEFCAKQHFISKGYDVIIGNPPFIRYQNFPEEQREIAFQLMHKLGLKPNKLTNAWLGFLACSTLLLNSNGRIAMVIPAELFQVKYAEEMRKYLSDFFKRIFIITFRKLVFEDVQQEIVLLLAERNGSKVEGINVIDIQDLTELENLEIINTLESEVKPIDHSKDKWTKYFLSKEEIQLLNSLEEHPELLQLSDIAEVDVGVVTGENSFFLLNENQVFENGLEENVLNVVSRSNHLEGINFTEKYFSQNSIKGLQSYLFYPSKGDTEDYPEEVYNYIKKGKSDMIHTGYKCSIRKEWYIVPSVWIPDAFMLRQIHEYPKIIINKTRATCTDTIHRVKLKKKISGKTVSASFINSLTFAFAEITGRSYGGGVLTFEPSECERLPLPYFNDLEFDFDFIDKKVREGKITEVLDYNDKLILSDKLKLKQKEIKLLRNIWTKLKNRRLNRR